MKIKELQTILDARPSVAGNTFFIGFLYFLTIILSAAFLILGVGLLLEGFFSFKIFLNWLSRNLKIILNDEQRSQIAVSFGFISLILGVIFGAVVVLCRMILARNQFIIHLEDWIFNNISEISRKSKTRTR